MPPIVEKLLLLLTGAIITGILSATKKFIKSHLPGRGKIKRTIEKIINNEFKQNLKEACGVDILTRGIRIEWDEKVDRDSYLSKEGDVVIKLSYSNDKNQSRSFTKALMLFLEEAFIPEGKPFIGSEIHQGCKHTIAKEVTLKKDAESYRHFLSGYLSPLLLNDHSFESLMNKLELMSQRGNFRSIFLRELFILCGKGILPKSEMRSEVREYLDFMWDIANKREYFQEHGEDPPLSFIKQYIRISVVLVKRKTSLDTAPHVLAVKHAFENGARTVYVTGWGIGNVANTKQVAERLKSTGFKELCLMSFRAELEESVKEGICFVFGA